MSVLVVGAGPVGLTMACELARHGVATRIVDTLAAPSPWCRALGITPRTLEVWDDMGIAREAVDAGIWLDGGMMAVADQPIRQLADDLSDLPYSMLGLPQYTTEAILTAQLARLGGAIERGVGVTALAPTTDGVRVSFDHGDDATFAWVVGCDGAHSTVRKAAGIDFEGEPFPGEYMLGDVHVDWDVPRGVPFIAIHPVPDDVPGIFVAIPLPERGRYRVSTGVIPELADPSHEGGHGIQAQRPGPTLEQLQGCADRLLPKRAVLSDLRWSSIFKISLRLASRYREGRLFLAGDAAHIHPPTGGQGMNTGIQDAYNLAWKLARVMRGTAPASLLDSYETERRPVGADVLARTRAATMHIGERAAHGRLDDTQLLVSYAGTPWVGDDGGDPSAPKAGDRVPDCTGLRRHGVGFPLRLFDVLRGTQHVLLVHRTDGEGLEALAASFDRSLVRVVAIVSADVALAEPVGVAVLRDADGTFAAAFGSGAGVYLVRPDGHIGWRGRHWTDRRLLVHLARIMCLNL